MEKATEQEVLSVRDEMASLRGARLGGLGRKGEMGAKSFAQSIWSDVFKMVGDKEVYRDVTNKTERYGMDPVFSRLGFIPADPYLTIDVKQFKMKWMTKDLEEAFSDISRHICAEVCAEFYTYVESGKSPGVESTSKYPAMARGREDMDSLINSLQIVRSERGYAIQVVNKVWLYQEYGFDMKGKLPSREVAIKILQWAFQKGIVHFGEEGEFEVREGKILTQKRKGRYGLMTTEVHERRLNWENYEASAVWGDNKALDKLMWMLTQAVVKNSSGRANRRLFLTTAYRSVVEDKGRIMGIMRDVMAKHGF